jgi:type II secretory pathway pseudopilin PulG
MNRRPAQTSLGFTLTELLVVIGLVVLLLALAVPAVTSIIRSSDRTQAEAQLRLALAAARDAAIASGSSPNAQGEGDAAAVFFYDESRQISIAVYRQAATITDRVQESAGDLPQNLIERDIFVPVPGFDPLRLPRGWGVRGYAPAGTIDDGNVNSQWNGWYESPRGRGPFDPNRGNWVFPETHFFSPGQIETDSGQRASAEPGSGAGPGLAQIGAIGGSGSVFRQTFMVRFEAGTGELAVANRRQALILAPSRAVGFRERFNPYRDYRIDRATDLGLFVRQVLAPRSGQSPLFRTPEEAARTRRQLIGGESIDSVLARPITELALYEERLLSAGIGAAALNPATGTVYGNRNNLRAWPAAPAYDISQFRQPQPNQLQISNRIAAWIEGRDWTRDTGSHGSAPGNFRPVASESRLFVIQRTGGQIREMEIVP